MAKKQKSPEEEEKEEEEKKRTYSKVRHSLRLVKTSSKQKIDKNKNWAPKVWSL